MSADNNFVYDSEGDLTVDKSKKLKISYDWRGMPVEFVHDVNDVKKAYKLLMAYDGSGRRISKTRYSKNVQYGYWTRDVVTHYTGIGTEVREAMRRSASPKTTVVVNLPQDLGRYMPEDAVDGLNGVSGSQFAGFRPPAKFEWFLKNHLGSTMLVYGTSAYNDPFNSGYKGGVKAAYDYRAFGEQVDLTVPAEKVTENFTGKEKDDETELNYFGARYLDPMLGMWTSVDAKRQYQNPYLYAGNNPIMRIDPDGNADALGVVNTGVHVLAGVSLVGLGYTICESVIGCGVGAFLMGTGFADILLAPSNLLKDAKDQSWMSEKLVDQMPPGLQDAVEMAENIGTVKSAIDKEKVSTAVDIIGKAVDYLKDAPEPFMRAVEEPLLPVVESPADNTSVFAQ